MIAEAALARVKIVLVEPAGELNVGSIARAMKNMGLRNLILVNPQCDRLSDAARQMAVHAIDILENATIVDSLPAALQGCQRAIATTARTRSHYVPLEDPRTTLPWLLAAPSALIFGREDRGLNNLELSYAQRCIRIPSHPDYPSLNLAQAVGICCYELYHSRAAIAPNPELALEVANLEVLEAYYQHLETVLLKIGYLHPHTAASRMEKFRSLFHRANLSAAEVALLRGILRQMEWAQRQGIENDSEIN